MPLPRKLLFQQGTAGNPVKHPAEDVRLSLGGLWTPDGSDATKVRSGILWGPGASGFAPLQVVAASASVTVKPGRCVVQGATAGQGAYVGTIESDVARPLSGALTNPGLPASGQFKAGRVLIRITDQLYGDAADGWEAEVYLGAAASTAAAAALPTRPNNAVQLRTFTVDSSGAITLTGTPEYTAAMGEVVPCTSATRPSVGWRDQTIYETDTGYYRRWNSVTGRWVYCGFGGSAATLYSAPLHAPITTARTLTQPYNAQGGDAPIQGWTWGRLDAAVATLHSNGYDFVMTESGMYNIQATADSDYGSAGRSGASLVFGDGQNFFTGGVADGRHRASGYAGAGYVAQPVTSGDIYLEAGATVRLQIFTYCASAGTINYNAWMNIIRIPA